LILTYYIWFILHLLVCRVTLSRPEEKVDRLADELANKDGKICEFRPLYLLEVDDLKSSTSLNMGQAVDGFEAVAFV